MNLYTNYILISAVIFLLILLNFTLGSATTIPKDSQNNESYWNTGKSMSEDRNELTAVVLDDKVYAMGGEDIATGGGQKDSVEVYDIAQDKWLKEDIALMPLPLDHTSAAVFDGKIYVVGGFLKNKVPTDKLFIYDPKTNEWQEGKSLPSPRGAMGAEFVNGILYVIGGVNSSHIPVNSNLAYDPKTNSWSTKAPMPTARHHLQTVVIDGKIFALGGRILGDGILPEEMQETLTNFDRNEMYDTRTDSWVILDPMLSKRSGFAAAVPSDGNIYVFGGQGVGQGVLMKEVEKYNPTLNEWTYDKPIPTARAGIIAIPFGDKIYVLGGQFFDEDGGHPLNLNELFHISENVQ